ncbi:hypothetical protein N0V93_007277 [Gnomoniopsis smithogilvyi]|uniref:Uncharacterized protein n=1 Tax=Gnomoniopsis smithogilvyi TaxID=1191159 RepID=A0A9W8YTI5_9PEZI|nr:hypothetical protein N0V93_007277 [Gnomoniopsis smithogilvyi]
MSAHPARSIFSRSLLADGWPAWRKETGECGETDLKEQILGTTLTSAADPVDYTGLGAGQHTGGSNGRPGASETAAAFIDAALRQHTAPWYWHEEGKGFAQHPALRKFVEKFTGWGDKTKPVLRTLLRNNTPGNKAIGVHYDQTFMRYGEPTSVTAWVPIGDISLEGGGLIYLENGTELGAEIETDFTRKAKAAGMSNEEMFYAFNQHMLSTGMLTDCPGEFGRKQGKRWLVTAYEAGDVVLHKAHAVMSITIQPRTNCLY